MYFVERIFLAQYIRALDSRVSKVRLPQNGFSPPKSRFQAANFFFFNWLQFVNKKWIFYHFRSMKRANGVTEGTKGSPKRPTLKRHTQKRHTKKRCYTSDRITALPYRIKLFGKLPGESHFRVLSTIGKSISYFEVLRKLFCFSRVSRHGRPRTAT